VGTLQRQKGETTIDHSSPLSSGLFQGAKENNTLDDADKLFGSNDFFVFSKQKSPEQ
jgi:hypothetical protein